MNSLIPGGNPHNNYPVYIDGKLFHFEEPQVNIEDILNKADKSPVSCYSVWQGLEGCDFRLLRPNEKVDLRNIGAEKFRTMEPVIFNYQVNDQPETTDQTAMPPLQILKQAAIDHEKEYLVQIFRDEPEKVYAWLLDVPIKMVCTGMKFVSRPWVPLADIEELGKNCKPAPVAKQYRVKIQNKYHIVNSPYLPQSEIIRLGGKQEVDRWDVLVFYSNSANPVKISKDEVVNLQQPCILHFVLQPKSQTEGRDGKREFVLPIEDQSFLNAQSLPWETLLSNHGNCLIIHDFLVPPGYNVSKVQVALIIPPSYPAAQIDMAYFYPALQLVSGKSIMALTSCDIDGRIFQRWSRHRAANEWIPGVDNIATHLFLVNNWLSKEVNQ